jgi:hypothetical protein
VSIEEPKIWKCERCGFFSKAWLGCERWKFCTTCQRIEDRADAERRRSEAKRAAELAEIETFIEREKGEHP